MKRSRIMSVTVRWLLAGRPSATIASALWLVVTFAGCATEAPATIDDQAWPGADPLPYNVGLVSHADWQGPLEVEERPGMLRYSRPRERVLDQLATDLVTRGVVSRATVLDAGTYEDAIREAKNYDLLISAHLEASKPFGAPEIHPGWATVEVIGWLFGGVPAWFTPSVSHTTEARLTLEVLDVQQRHVRDWIGAEDSAGPAPAVDWEYSVQSSVQSSSMHDRADFDGDLDQYALSIVVPPMLLHPTDTRRASRSLTTAVDRDLFEKIETGFKTRLAEEDRHKPVRVLFVSVDGASGDAIAELRSEGESPLIAVDLYRRAEGALNYRWKADEDALRELNETLVGDGQGRARIRQAVPLESGENLITVRVLRRDGARASRSWVVVKSEEKE